MYLVFDGGILTAEEIKNIVLQKEELIEYRFVSMAEAVTLLAANAARRLPKAIAARERHATVYLEDGEIK